MADDSIIDGPNHFWIREEEARLWKEACDNFWGGVMWGTPKREPREDDNVKLAWVLIKGKRTMVGVDNKTMKGYKLRDDIPSWDLPLVPIEYDKFERWCTSFDV